MSKFKVVLPGMEQHEEDNAPITKKVLKEVLGTEVPKMLEATVPKMLEATVPKMLEAIVPKMLEATVPKMLEAIVPKMLGEFTEQVLLPAVQQIVRAEIVQSEHRLKVWVDERLADLRADIVLLTRKEDRKVLKIVDLLREKNILNDSEVQEILHMEPFAAQ